jgi:hypothetical protein
MKKYILVIFLISLITLVSAIEIEISNEGDINNRIINLDFPQPDPFDNSTDGVNSSVFADIWITDEGNKDNVADILIDELGDVDATAPSVNDFLRWTGSIWQKFGLFSTQNLWTVNQSFENVTILDRIFIGNTNHWIKLGAQELFKDISTQAFWFNHNEELGEGSVVFLFTTNSSNQIRVNILAQTGRNNSGGILGNSWMVIPNNLSDNLSIISNCFFVANELGKILRVNCDTTDSGADFIVQDNIQAWGKLFSDQGIRTEKTADFFLDGNTMNIIGEVSITQNRTESIGFSLGAVLKPVDEDFDLGSLGVFFLLTSTGSSGEWRETNLPNCFDNLCARSSRTTPSGAESIIETNFSTVNIGTMNISFRLNTTELDVGDYLNVTIDNNEGTLTELYSLTDGVDVNSFINTTIPSSMDNRSEVSLRFICKVNKNNEQCFIDNVLVAGNATASTDQNITKFDTLIKSQKDNVFLFYNDTSEFWSFSPERKYNQRLFSSDAGGSIGPLGSLFLKLGDYNSGNQRGIAADEKGALRSISGIYDVTANSSLANLDIVVTIDGLIRKRFDLDKAVANSKVFNFTFEQNEVQFNATQRINLKFENSNFGSVTLDDIGVILGYWEYA